MKKTVGLCLLLLSSLAAWPTTLIEDGMSDCFWTGLIGTRARCAEGGGTPEWNFRYSMFDSMPDPGDRDNWVGQDYGIQVVVTDNGRIHAVRALWWRDWNYLLTWSYLYYYSDDNGETWSAGIDVYPFQGANDTFLTAMNVHLAPGQLITDGEDVWFVNSVMDHDGSNDPDWENIYGEMMRVTRLPAGATTWDAPVISSDVTPDITPTAAAVAPNGDLYVVGTDYYRSNHSWPAEGEFTFHVGVSADGGQTWSVTELSPNYQEIDQYTPTYKQNVVFDSEGMPHISVAATRVSDGYWCVLYFRPTGAQSWGSPVEMQHVDAEAIWDRPATRLLIHPDTDKLFYLYAVEENNIYMKTSEDNGVTWSSEQNIFFADYFEIQGQHGFFATMTDAGRIHVFVDAEIQSFGHPSQSIFWLSSDENQVFQPPEPLWYTAVYDYEVNGWPEDTPGVLAELLGVYGPPEDGGTSEYIELWESGTGQHQMAVASHGENVHVVFGRWNDEKTEPFDGAGEDWYYGAHHIGYFPPP